MKEFSEVVGHYLFLGKEKLKTELLITSAHLHTAFAELLKLLKIIVVTPMATSEPERCFSTLKRIKLFLRSSTGNDRLSALTMLSIEKGMIEDIKDLNDLVTDYFATRKSKRMDFVLK